RNERFAWGKRFLGLTARYGRGLVESLGGASNNFDSLASDALDDTCVRELAVYRQWTTDPSVEASVRAWLPAMRLRAFAISAIIDAPDLARLLAQLDALERLALSGAGDRLDTLLAARLPRLDALDVSAGGLGPADVRRIGERFAVRGLDLGANRLAGLPVSALRGVERL